MVVLRLSEASMNQTTGLAWEEGQVMRCESQWREGLVSMGLKKDL